MVESFEVVAFVILGELVEATSVGSVREVGAVTGRDGEASGCCFCSFLLFLHPRPVFLQHQACFSGDQPVCQCEKATVQSKSSCEELPFAATSAVVVAGVGSGTDSVVAGADVGRCFEAACAGAGGGFADVVDREAVEGPDAFATLTVAAATVALAVVAMAVVSSVVGVVAGVASRCKPALAAPHQAARGPHAVHSASDLLQ